MDYTIRYQRRDQHGDHFLAYHFLGKRVFEHQPKQKVVHHFKEVDEGSAITGGHDFFSIQDSGDIDFSLWELPIDAMKLFQSGQKAVAKLGYLEKHKFPVDVRTALVEDIMSTEYRASVLRIDYDKKNMPYSNQGFLLLQGKNRDWIFLPKKENGKDYLSVLPGNSKNFQKLVSGLVDSRS